MLGGGIFAARWGLTGDFAAVALGRPACTSCSAGLLMPANRGQCQSMRKENAHFAPAGIQILNQAFWTLSHQVITQKMPFHLLVSFGQKTDL
jgi:hypothetical protein